MRFRALEHRTLLDRVPESGLPPDELDQLNESGQTMQEDDEGDILECKVVHGFRWYRVRVTTRAASTGSLNLVGWVPLQSLDSDAGSWYGSEEAAELDGEEFIEILDPTTGEVIMPDSPRALRPPVWDEARDATFTAVQGFLDGFEGGRRDSRASRGGGGGGGDGGGGGTRGGGSRSAVRPVWLALAAGKLFLREKASGALAADEIAVLRLPDLSLEGIVGLADLPIPGFSESRSPEAPPGDDKGLGDRGAAVGGVVDRDEKEEVEEKEEKEEEHEEQDEEEEEVVGFAFTDLGAFVAECSSNSETSGGILQVWVYKRRPTESRRS